jgi:hypothetical protein
MSRFTAVYGVLAAVFVLGIAPAGCGHSDRKAAEATARAFLEAADRGDNQALRATLTKQAQEAMGDDIGKRSSTERDHSEYVIGQAAIADDTARVPVTVQEKDSEKRVAFKMRREDGQWRIYALSLPLEADGGELTLDFEHPEAIAGQVFALIGKGMGEMFRGMGEGVSAMAKGFAEGFAQGVNSR